MTTAAKAQRVSNDNRRIGRGCPPHQQHGQFGPQARTGTEASDQGDVSDDLPDQVSDAPTSGAVVKVVREHQYVDLAMLRLAFRDIMRTDEERAKAGEKATLPLRLLTCTELSHLVSAVTRIHGAERELPANVEVEIRGWSERHEQIVLRRRARLLEFRREAEHRAVAEDRGTETGPAPGRDRD